MVYVSLSSCSPFEEMMEEGGKTKGKRGKRRGEGGGRSEKLILVHPPAFVCRRTVFEDLSSVLNLIPSSCFACVFPRSRSCDT